MTKQEKYRVEVNRYMRAQRRLNKAAAAWVATVDSMEQGECSKKGCARCDLVKAQHAYRKAVRP